MNEFNEKTFLDKQIASLDQNMAKMKILNQGYQKQTMPKKLEPKSHKPSKSVNFAKMSPKN